MKQCDFTRIKDLKINQYICIDWLQSFAKPTSPGLNSYAKDFIISQSSYINMVLHEIKASLFSNIFFH